MGSRSDESHLWANLSVTALGYYFIGKVSALSQHPVSSDADVNHHILLAGGLRPGLQQRTFTLRTSSSTRTGYSLYLAMWLSCAAPSAARAVIFSTCVIYPRRDPGPRSPVAGHKCGPRVDAPDRAAPAERGEGGTARVGCSPADAARPSDTAPHPAESNSHSSQHSPHTSSSQSY